MLEKASRRGLIAIVVFGEFAEIGVSIYGSTALAEFEAALTNLQFLDLGIKS